MKIALAQINYHIGNFRQNEEKVLSALETARSRGADLIVFAELAVSGYPPRDFLEFDDFVDKCLSSVHRIAGKCNGIAAIIGGPSYNPAPRGKRLHNSAFFLANGKVEKVFHKTLLPNYDIFDEYRYFEPNTRFELLEFKGRKIAVTICEDLWNIGNEQLYPVSPMEKLIGGNPDLVINIAASPFHYEQEKQRKAVLRENTGLFGIPLVYVNHVGAQTELLFDGGSLVMNNRGEIVTELKYFEEDLQIFDFENLSTATPVAGRNPEVSELLEQALVMGIRNYFQKLGFDKAILGLSGGIDSAVTCVLAAKALGEKNVLGVLMPSEFSSGHSITDAEQLAANLGCRSIQIPIKEVFVTYNKVLQPHFKGTKFGIAEENLQARIRGTLLMALSNKFGHILLNTSNKSEAAVGYSTLYGDMNGGLSVLGDVYKTQVYLLARYLNRDGEIIPENTIVKPPSAELRPNQKDTDSLPEYDILDTILLEYIENRKGPNELVEMGFDRTVVDRVLHLVNMNEYKRYQTPPILRVSRKAFGMGRRMPIVARYLALE